MNIGGKWRGYYEQQGSRHAIEAEFSQHGQRFTGRMTDEDTLIMGPPEQVSEDELREALKLDDESPAPMELVTSLPSDSTIEGQIDGETVRFVKKYIGSQTSSLWTDNVHVEIDLPNVEIQYEGRFEAQGDIIRGTWCIGGIVLDDEDDPADFEDRGLFALQREQD
jgi:hypothetical protein